jgi:hypothetical protein
MSGRQVYVIEDVVWRVISQGPGLWMTNKVEGLKRDFQQKQRAKNKWGKRDGERERERKKERRRSWRKESPWKSCSG